FGIILEENITTSFFLNGNIFPNEQNYANKDKLDAALKKLDVKVHDELHVSGHASRDEQEELINILKPPFADKAPIANNIESPVRNGVTTKPVYAKIITKTIKYDHVW
ncbi:hypothetical protein HGB13_04210, partial [bacterium]|nr:hypothetical protein [bacterium]